MKVPSPPPTPPQKKKKMLKNISTIHMKSVCLVCFTVEFNSQTLHIFNILRSCERVVFLEMNQFQSLKNKERPRY